MCYSINIFSNNTHIYYKMLFVKTIERLPWRRTNESIVTSISPPTCRMPMSWANDWLANARKDSNRNLL